jgi:hypothetical protein
VLPLEQSSSQKFQIIEEESKKNGSFPIKYLDVFLSLKRIKREPSSTGENEKENLRLEKKIVVLRRSTKAY